MDNVLLVAYLLIVIAMIAVILIQRSEGGGLGIGGGGNNSFMTARGSANVLTRTTAILATLFFLLAIGLTVVKSIERGSTAILDSATQQTQTDGTVQTNSDGTLSQNALDALNQLQQQTSGEDPATTTDSAAPATDSPALAIPSAPAGGTTGGSGN